MELTVVGLDGASRNVFGRWLDELPNIRDTIESGYDGTLHSTDPPLTNVAWTSFATGKAPGQTGVFDWVYINDQYEPQQYHGDDVHHETLYDMVPGSTFVNLPAAYPRVPMADDASVVYAFDAPDESIAVPDEFKQFDEYENYCSGKTDEDLSDIEQLKQLRDIARKRFEFSKRAFEETDTLFYVLFSATDFALHIIPEMTGEYERIYRQLYRDIDEYVGWFRERSENIALMSDHGFQENTRIFHVQEWFAQNGYLARESESDDTGTVQTLTERALSNEYVYAVAKSIHRALTDTLDTDVTEDAYDSLTKTNLDYSETKVFKDGGLWNPISNRTDAFERGCVPPEELPELCEALAHELSSLTDPETGEPVFEYVRPGPDVYGDDYRNAPAVAYNPADGMCMGGFTPSGQVFEDTQVFNHRKRGYYALDGPSFTSGTEEADIIDIAPTVLAVVGQAVPADLDGDVIDSALATDNPVEYGEPSALTKSPPTRERTEEDDDILQKRLEDLGYI
jgi:predicted AlkP superfamily phosphohydrolase/phosphomutase